MDPSASTHAVTLDAPQLQSSFFEGADVAPAAPKANITTIRAIAIRVITLAVRRS
jgi:hypothetical protein